jgi:hypothetical protein
MTFAVPRCRRPVRSQYTQSTPKERIMPEKTTRRTMSGKPKKSSASNRTNRTKTSSPKSRRPTGGAATKKPRSGAPSASALIDARIAELGDWRGVMLSRLRAILKQADPDVVEEWKWRGTPIWSHDGIICTGETYKSVVKMTFAKGASLSDPTHMFNSSMEGNTRRAIDFHQGEKINATALKALVRAAVALNQSRSR